MGIKDFIQNLSSRNREKKEQFREMELQVRMQKKLEDMQKSSNERELERFQKEEREESIKQALEIYRKKRDEDIKFGHNPLNTPNITAHADWEVMKERNLFSGNGNMFSSQKNIFTKENQVPAWRRKWAGVVLEQRD